MATGEADICNVALARIGQRQFITSLDPAVDTSANAALCALLYPKARNSLLTKTTWEWSTRAAILAVDAALYPGAAKMMPGWKHAYSDPSDLLEAQYIFDGVRPGESAVPGVFGPFSSPLYVPSMAIAGADVPSIPFQHAGGHIFTDWADSPAAWSSTTTYGLNAIVSSGVTFYRSLVAGNLNNLVTDASKWVAVTDSSSATLVYTAAQTDTNAAFPQQFCEALSWRLAVDLALSLATKPDLAMGLRNAAEQSLSEALAAEGNARQPDPKAASRYITSRY